MGGGRGQEDVQKDRAIFKLLPPINNPHRHLVFWSVPFVVCPLLIELMYSLIPSIAVCIFGNVLIYPSVSPLDSPFLHLIPWFILIILLIVARDDLKHILFQLLSSCSKHPVKILISNINTGATHSTDLLIWALFQFQFIISFQHIHANERVWHIFRIIASYIIALAVFCYSHKLLRAQ